MTMAYAADRVPLNGAERVVCWFSCGATSAVATKITIQKYAGTGLPVVVAYCDTGSEHADNKRFMSDCAEWFGQDILTLKSEKYRNIWEVFEKRRYIVGINGAPCTTELKVTPRQKFERVDTDIQVFGFDADERHRADRYQDNYKEVALHCPLIDEGLTKNDCKDILLRAGIDLPAVYEQLPNANCIGCVKGGAGYWQVIRREYPEVYNRMAKLEREFDAAILKRTGSDGERLRVFLDELPEDYGRDITPKPIQCGLFCSDVIA